MEIQRNNNKKKIQEKNWQCFACFNFIQFLGLEIIYVAQKFIDSKEQHNILTSKTHIQ